MLRRGLAFGVLFIVFLFSEWSEVAGIGIDLGLCAGNTLACQCGDPGYVVQLPVKHCTFFYKFKPYCKPCDLNTGVSKEQMCAKYKNCQDCKPGLPSCAGCPPNKYGLWCTGVCNCKNGGTCSSVDGKCTCPPGFKGANCQESKSCYPPPAPSPLLEKRVPADMPFYIEYSCPQHYKMIGLARITCLPNQQWSNPPPKCARLCPIPSSPSNGRVLWDSGEEYVTEGHPIRFDCNDTYALIGRNSLVCRSDGTWSNEIPVCEKLTECRDPGTIQYGSREVHSVLNLEAHPFVAGTKVLFSCSREFFLLGPRSVTCRTDGTWSASLPSCIKVSFVEVDCDTKGSEVLDEVGIPVRLECPPGCSVSSEKVWGTVIYFEESAVCQAAIHARRVTNAGGTVYVVNNGEYSYFLGSEMNGVPSKSRTDLGPSFRFHYNPEWSLYENASKEEGCPEGWVEVEDLCAFILPQALAWEKAKGTCSNLGAALSITSEQAVRVDNLTLAMQEKGIKSAWSEIVLFNGTTTGNHSEEYNQEESLCPLLDPRRNDNPVVETPCDEAHPFVCLRSLTQEKERCEDPGNFENGFAKLHGREDEGFLVGSIVKYSCAALHFLKGSKEIGCTSNLTWSGPKPECVKVTTCREPVTILFGYVETLRPSKNDVLRRKANFHPTTNVTLRQNRKISLHPPSGFHPNFLPSELKTSPEVNVTIPEGYHAVGTRAVYSCQSRYYQLIGSQTRRCQDNGKWSGRVASCIAVCGRSDSPRTPFITNGNATDMGQWPWQAAISQWFVDYSVWFTVCGGALLNERWIITAAHCVTYSGSTILIPYMEVRVHLGKYHRNTDKDDEYVQMRLIKELHIHHDYDPNQYDADIALIELTEPVILTSRVQPVCLPTTSTTRHNIVPGKVGVVTGWGLTENATYGESLRQAVIPVVSDKTCQNSYEDVKVLLTITENMYCAGYANSSIDTCSGDSGGPMVFADDTGSQRRWVLEGVVSWGSPNGCGKPNQYGGYTIVSRFLDWINEYI